MTIKEYVEGQKCMPINDWLKQIKDDGLSHLETKILAVADSLGRITIDDMDFVTDFKKSVSLPTEG